MIFLHSLLFRGIKSPIELIQHSAYLLILALCKLPEDLRGGTGMACAPHGSSHRQLELRQVAAFPEELRPRAATGTVCVTGAQRSHCSLRRSHRAWPRLAA